MDGSSRIGAETFQLFNNYLIGESRYNDERR